MVKRRRYLDDRLQKALLRFFKPQPDQLPVLMRRKEFPSVIAAKPLRQLSASPVKDHIHSIGEYIPS